MNAFHVSSVHGLPSLDWRGSLGRGLGRASHGGGVYLCTSPRVCDRYKSQVGVGATVYHARIDVEGFVPTWGVATLLPAFLQYQGTEHPRHKHATADHLVHRAVRSLGASGCADALLGSGVPGLLFCCGDGSTTQSPNILVIDVRRITLL